MKRKDPWQLLDLRRLDRSDWELLLENAEVLSGEGGRRPLLEGRRFAAVFFNSSLRTRTAFEIAAFDLGAHATILRPGAGLWGMETRAGVVMDGEAAEHVREGFGVLSRMTDGIGVRVFAGLEDAEEDETDSGLNAIAASCSVPMLSLESAMDHPHQGLADAFTVRRRVGERTKICLSWAPHVKPLPRAVPHAALLAFAREGHEIHLAHPEGFDLAKDVLEDARTLAEAAGGNVKVTQDQHAALDGARVVYAKSWGSTAHYGHPAAATAALAAHRGWIIDAAAMDRGDDAWFMHCLPVRRGVVVADEVLDGDRSLVLEQAEARLHVQKATLCRAVGVQP